MFSESHFPLRHTRWIVLVLLFCMGIATASPLVKPKAMVLVCTGANGLVLVDTETGGDAAKLGAMALDCADCLPTVLPPADITVFSAEKPVQECIAIANPLPVPDAHCLSPPSRGPPPVLPT